ncbi:uncharacterized protein LOC126988734 isoform X2 [Eriocheir sinensis]|uniref:uncharacterized protein LOC126988734 isoform X2 n=1 Tax=Eriocheir sinensis TaxID=95602 RepID=UPI0021C59C11|nr:uncharacterized protein LOC126988734 isoform X2 [Eriocheir sinensis]
MDTSHSSSLQIPSDNTGMTALHDNVRCLQWVKALKIGFQKHTQAICSDHFDGVHFGSKGQLLPTATPRHTDGHEEQPPTGFPASSHNAAAIDLEPMELDLSSTQIVLPHYDLNTGFSNIQENVAAEEERPKKMLRVELNRNIQSPPEECGSSIQPLTQLHSVPQATHVHLELQPVIDECAPAPAPRVDFGCEPEGVGGNLTRPSSSPKYSNAPQEKDIHDKKVQSCGTRDNIDTDNATLCEKQIVTKLEYKSKRCHIPRKVKRLKKDATPDISLPGNTSESAPQDTAENGVALDPCKAVPHPGEQDAPETQDDMEVTDEQVLQQIQEYRDLQEQEQQLKEELEAMDQKLMVSSLTSISLDDRKTRLCTGLPSLAVFTWLIDLLSGHLASFDCISKPDQLLITLMKLRLGLSTQDLAFRFNTSTQAIENILSDAIPIMACKLDFLICWPVRTHPRNIPRPFKPNFKNCSVIIDCLEFPTEKPLNITAESQTWSDIKHQTTIKCLVGITPYGSFSYVSQCWGGRITDRELVLVSGVLEHVYHGDVVITCKDFSIQQELSEKRAKLIVLESLYSPEKLIDDHDLVAVSFIKKAFKRIKRYKILSQTLPIPLLPYIDEVVTCCLAFSNLQPKFQLK